MTKDFLRSFYHECAQYPAKLAPVERKFWNDCGSSGYRSMMIAVWRSRTFLAHLCLPEPNTKAYRFSVNRCKIDVKTGRWVDGITWDELMQLKQEAGLGEFFAVEVFPPADRVVNVANMRHLWIFDDPPDIGWKTKYPDRPNGWPQTFYRIMPSILSAVFKTGYLNFRHRAGVTGLAKIHAGRQEIDILAVVSKDPGTGQFKDFINDCKCQFKEVSFWAIMEPALNEILTRYGFEKTSRVNDDNSTDAGYIWHAE